MRILSPACTLLMLLIGAFGLSAQNATVTVEKGDTLYSIGRSYSVSVQALIEKNGILNPRSLSRGTSITIPFTHRVQEGDTLYSISRSYDVSVDALCAYNDIEKNKPIHIGQIIKLPHQESLIKEGEQGPLTAPETNTAQSTSGAHKSEDEERKVAGGEDDGEKKKEVEGGKTKYSRESNGIEEASNSTETDIREVSYEKSESGNSLKWPHSGKRVRLTGKLKGTQIEGEVGDRVASVSSGKVVWVAPYRGYGELVMVESKDGHIYAYGGNEETFVEVGDRVEAGTVLGRLGINPIEQSAKVFFFVYRNGEPVDPAHAPRG